MSDESDSVEDKSQSSNSSRKQRKSNSSRSSKKSVKRPKLVVTFDFGSQPTATKNKGSVIQKENQYVKWKRSSRELSLDFDQP